MPQKRDAGPADKTLLRGYISQYVTAVKAGKVRTELKKFIERIEEFKPRSIDDEIKFLRAQLKPIRDAAMREIQGEINWLNTRQPGDPTDGPVKYTNPNYWVTDGLKDRFGNEGFDVHRMVYGYTKTWDWQELEVGVLVPKDLNPDLPVPVHVKWHGGGFTTQSWDFQPWFAGHLLRLAKELNAIIVAPNYRLMPYANADGIKEDVRTFWEWYNNKQTFEHRLPRIGALKKAALAGNLKRQQLLLSGESAGGFLAAYSHLNVVGLPIEILYPQYPMLAHYKRKFGMEPINDEADWQKWRNNGVGEVMDYMGYKMTKSEVYEHAPRIVKVIEKYDELGTMPTVTKEWPPLGMMAANNLSLAKTKDGRQSLWQTIFQRNSKDPRDILEMVRRPGFQPANFAPIHMHHGNHDLNCPIEDTREFAKLMQGLQKEKVDLLEVNYVLEAGGEKNNVTTEVSHAPDHYCHEDVEVFLAKSFLEVADAWVWSYDYTEWEKANPDKKEAFRARREAQKERAIARVKKTTDLAKAAKVA